MYATDKWPMIEVMKYAALSANTITDEPIDVVLYEAYPHPVSDGGQLRANRVWSSSPHIHQSANLI